MQLTAKFVLDIRAQKRAGRLNVRNWSDILGVSGQAVRNIANGRTYAWVQAESDPLDWQNSVKQRLGVTPGAALKD